MKTIGEILLVLGLVGLLLILIFWLPAEINLLLMVLISAICVASVWGGGKLSLAKSGVGKGQDKTYEPLAQQPHSLQTRIACPKCGRQGNPHQRFCGGCGSAMVSCCPACGAVVASESRFCGNCGTKLG